MNEEIVAQRNYWNNEADAFSRIYSHRKSRLSNMLDNVFRKDMYERYVFTIKHCEPIKDRTFLDVGCGNGLYSLELARKGARRVLGIDIAEVMVGLCKEASRKENLDGVCEFQQTDLFEYISDPLPVLKKMREMSTDKVILAFPRLWTWRAPVRKARLNARGCDVY